MRSADTHFFLQDANYNVTAAVDDSTNAVVERYSYTPYGKVTYLDADFSLKAGQFSAIGNQHLYTGRERDRETGLQLNRNRYYAWHLGRWVNRDPIWYEGSPWNLYEHVGSVPTIAIDPTGLVAPIEVLPRTNARLHCESVCAAKGQVLSSVTIIPTWRARIIKCSCRPKPKKCGKCSPQQLAYLQDRKDSACSGAGIPRPGMSCKKLLDLALANHSCVTARQEIQRRCFPGKTDALHAALISQHKRWRNWAYNYDTIPPLL